MAVWEQRREMQTSRFPYSFVSLRVRVRGMKERKARFQVKHPTLVLRRHTLLSKLLLYKLSRKVLTKR
jgi:hypothetical protein